MNPTLYYTTHASTIGTLILVAGARGLRYVGLLGEGEAASDRLARLFSTPPAPTLLPLDGFFASATLEMDRYFRGAGARLTLPYELVGGTALQRAVWLEIARIPYGETISYSTLAENGPQPTQPGPGQPGGNPNATPQPTGTAHQNGPQPTQPGPGQPGGNPNATPQATCTAVPKGTQAAPSGPNGSGGNPGH